MDDDMKGEWSGYDWTEDGWKPGDAAVGPADESSHYKNNGRKVQVLSG